MDGSTELPGFYGGIRDLFDKVCLFWLFLEVSRHAVSIGEKFFVTDKDVLLYEVIFDFLVLGARLQQLLTHGKLGLV
jgi:hypothetical protein